jgi:uncharacterized protein (TIGR00645 family)
MIERWLEHFIFHSRWLLAPIYVGLSVCLAMLVLKFIQLFLNELPTVFALSEEKTLLVVLGLVDIALIGNLLLMVIFTGYENFVSKLDVAAHPDRPDWMGKIDFSGLKLKLIASIVAISSIQLLKTFLNVSAVSDRELMWQLGLQAAFVLSGVLLAVMDRLSERER